MRGGEVTLEQRLGALDEVLEHGQGRYDQGLLDEVAALRAKADERLARGEQVVVVALAGGTGSGKSSLFNALAGQSLAAVGVRRPVTTAARALAVGDAAPAGRLLDWLGVHNRHHSADGRGLPPGLVLIDLPDHDSVEVSHRQLVDRFVERVDVLVWVVDPLKYAQRALHSDYLQRLTAHTEVVLVVLNRIDEVAATQRRELLTDLRSILRDEGLGTAGVVATSAADGTGVGDLRARLARIVDQHRAASERIAADVRTVAVRLHDATGPARGAELDIAPVTDALGAAVGVDSLAQAAADDDRGRAKESTRPLLSRAVAGLASGPARALRGLRRVRPRTSVRARPGGPGSRAGHPPPSPVAVRHALLALADGPAAGLPPAWGRRVRGVAAQSAQDLPLRIARALDAVPLGGPRRRWWPLLAVVWSVAELVAATGLVWLLLLGVVSWLQLPAPPTPRVTPVLPLPTALALGGGLAWLIAGWLRNRLIAVGAARHRRRVQRRLRAAVSDAARAHALGPLQAELDAHDALAAAVRTAAA